MNRKLERNLLRASAVWDVCIGLVTMFGYYPWFEEQGIAAFQNQNQYEYLQSSLIGMISKVVLIVALATILMRYQLDQREEYARQTNKQRNDTLDDRLCHHPFDHL